MAIRTLLLVPALLIGVLAAAAPANAGEEARAAALDRLFDELARTQSPAEAALVEGEIWRIWTESGSPTVDLLMQRGLEALETQDYAVALDLFSTVTELDPFFPEGWNKRATLYYLIDDYEASIADVTQTLALEPRHWPAMMGLAIMFEETGQAERALAAYRAALDINPQLESATEAVRRLTVEVEGRGI